MDADASSDDATPHAVRPVVLVSACLLGIACRYDGGDAKSEGLAARLSGCHIVPVCPEQLGGLPTPRPACEIVARPSASAPENEPAGATGTGADGADGATVLAGRARVVRTGDDGGADVTAAFVRGAEQTLAIAQAVGATAAYLTDGSPSCGVEKLTGRDPKSGAKLRRPGAGVTAALLRQHGLAVHAVHD